MSGWIKIHRSMLDHFVMSDPEYLSVWIHLLLLANHSDNKRLFNGKPTDVNRGQLITSRDAIAIKTGVNSSKVHRILKALEIEHQIEQHMNSRYRLISITNYDKHQLSEQPANHTRTAAEPQLNTPKECKESKECKETTNRRFTPPSVDEVKGYCLERSNSIDPETFVDHYQANGWMRGKNKIKCWKSCVRTWEKRNETNQRDNRSKAKRVSDAIKEFATEGDFAEQLG